MSNIRNLSFADVKDVVDIHLAAFPGFFLSSLGSAYLEFYYTLLLEYDGGLLLGIETDGPLAGFVAGFRDPARFYALLARSRRRQLIPLLKSVMRRPSLLGRMLYNVRTVGSRADTTDASGPDTCELSSIGLSPEVQGRRAGKALVLEFLETCRRAGVHYVDLTTDAADNEPVNRFYLDLGFTLEDTCAAGGDRLMNAYRYSLVGERD